MYILYFPYFFKYSLTTCKHINIYTLITIYVNLEYVSYRLKEAVHGLYFRLPDIRLFLNGSKFEVSEMLAGND